MPKRAFSSALELAAAPTPRPVRRRGCRLLSPWAFRSYSSCQHWAHSAGGSRGRPGRYLTAHGTCADPGGFELTRGAGSQVGAGLRLYRRQATPGSRSEEHAANQWVIGRLASRLAVFVRRLRGPRRDAGARPRTSATGLLLGRVSAFGAWAFTRPTRPTLSDFTELTLARDRPPRTGLASWQGRQLARSPRRLRTSRWTTTPPGALELFRASRDDVGVCPRTAGEGDARGSLLLGSQGTAPSPSVSVRRETTVDLIGFSGPRRRVPWSTACRSTGAQPRPTHRQLWAVTSGCVAGQRPTRGHKKSAYSGLNNTAIYWICAASDAPPSLPSADFSCRY